MKIEIPNTIFTAFLTLLDVAQAGFTDADVEQMSDDEKACIAFVEGLLAINGVAASKRWANPAEKVRAATAFRSILEAV